MSNNIDRVIANNQDVTNSLCNAKQDCSDVVHVAVFFDGTGNNKDADEALKKWANPARLWRNARALKETKDAVGEKYPNYAIYVSGVGTRFNGELSIFQRAGAMLEDGPAGLGMGNGGTRRLEYGQSEVDDALQKTLINNAKKLENELAAYALSQKNTAFAELNKNLAQHRLIKKINYSAIGFSRGAALARAFTNQIIWQCDADCDGLKYATYPIEFKFLGLFDTVASFGLPATNLNNNVTFEGRDLVVDERVQKCVQLVAGNEQRFSFPLDLISSKDGTMRNPNWSEIVYPGMHSDIGGGYQPDTSGDGVSDNFARITLKKMLDEALTAGVKLYSYDELKKNHIELFELQYQIQPDTQRLYDAVQSKMASNGSIESQVQASMKMFYSAYGTMQRKGIASPNQRDRKDLKKTWAQKLVPWGPANMATEISRLKAIEDFTSLEKQKGWRKIFVVFSPVARIYKFLLKVEGWHLESWEKDADDDVVNFYKAYVHDSKYGFLANVEPFSYFRQRTIYESRRSGKGQEVDQALTRQKNECVAADAKTQEKLKNAFQEAKNSSDFAEAS
ncbi:T6SS phospholipase effector Tle1-like catalytic domain-containing protein [Acinetobacter larvae]|uniref:T6SS Phospholipase effector Tle1-like catalytic domain-containing protein n=1 Tax=Acinetobacter larvae TaxID=1789224 RepID=A0A1B2LYC0_9GAMM|nr:DUF2235 domain-containing protein [Acinetobacter larvae]AOA57947.1 hypothetical protein BFG52_06025 [Acinetobacter larvae]